MHDFCIYNNFIRSFALCISSRGCFPLREGLIESLRFQSIRRKEGGAYLTAAWSDDNTVTVEGYFGASLLYSSTVNVSTSGPIWFDFDYFGVDTLIFSSTHDQFAMDNFTFNETAPIPEPATILFFISGLIGLAGFRRKLRR